MLKEVLPVSTVGEVNSPEQWAQAFHGAKRLTERQRRLMSNDLRWRLIQQYIPAGGRVLDAGCGAGEWTVFLSENGYRVTGLDYSAQLVSMLKDRYPDKDWKQGSIFDVDMNGFDGIISWGVIEHDESGPGKALEQFRKVLNRGGRLIVTVPLHDKWNERASSYLIKILNRRSEPESLKAFFQYYMTEGELASFVKQSSFAVLETGRVGPALLGKASPALYHRTKGNRVLSAILHRLFALLFSWTQEWYHMIYCVAESR